MDGHCIDLKVERLACGQAGGNQVFDDLLLPVNHDSTPRQLLEIDPVALTPEMQKNAVMRQPLLHHPGAHARGIEDIDALMLQDASTDAIFDVIAGSCASSTTDSMPRWCRR